MVNFTVWLDVSDQAGRSVSLPSAFRQLAVPSGLSVARTSADVCLKFARYLLTMRGSLGRLYTWVGRRHVEVLELRLLVRVGPMRGSVGRPLSLTLRSDTPNIQ